LTSPFFAGDEQIPTREEDEIGEVLGDERLWPARHLKPGRNTKPRVPRTDAPAGARRRSQATAATAQPLAPYCHSADGRRAEARRNADMRTRPGLRETPARGGGWGSGARGRRGLHRPSTLPPALAVRTLSPRVLGSAGIEGDTRRTFAPDSVVVGDASDPAGGVPRRSRGCRASQVARGARRGDLLSIADDDGASPALTNVTRW